MVESRQQLKSDWNLISGNDDELLTLAADFLNSEFGSLGANTQWSLELLKWKLGVANPFGEGRIFCAVIDGRVYATLSLTLKRINLNQQSLLVAEIGDSYTHPLLLSKSYEGRCRENLIELIGDSDYVRKSVFGRLTAEAIIWARKMNIKAIYGTPNIKSSAGYIKRLGFKTINNMNNQVFFRVILTTSLIQKKSGLPPLISQFVKWPLYIYSKLVFILPQIFFRLHGLQELCEAHYDDVQRLWDKRSSRNTLIIRDVNWLVWRYLRHPFNSYRIYVMTSNKKVSGWLVVKNEIVKGQRQIVLVDWFVGKPSFAFIGFIYKILSGLDYQSAIVKFWASNRYPWTSYVLRLISFSVYPVTLIYKALEDSTELLDLDGIDEFCIGFSDNV